MSCSEAAAGSRVPALSALRDGLALVAEALVRRREAVAVAVRQQPRGEHSLVAYDARPMTLRRHLPKAQASSTRMHLHGAILICSQFRPSE